MSTLLLLFFYFMIIIIIIIIIITIKLCTILGWKIPTTNILKQTLGQSAKIHFYQTLCHITLGNLSDLLQNYSMLFSLLPLSTALTLSYQALY